jgi:IS5 family transposase
MIHSESFRKLPQHLRERILERLRQVVEQPESEPRYAYLEPAERQRIGGILSETVPGFARR